MSIRSVLAGFGLMCCRFANGLSADEMAALFGTINEASEFRPSWNIAPGEQAAVVRRHPTTHQRHLDQLNWGFVPHSAKVLTTARRPSIAESESVARSPTFKDALQRQRCLVPAEAFYEWIDDNISGLRQPYAFARVDGAPLALAGLWDAWFRSDGTALRSFAILTVAANMFMSPIHDRMPVIVEQQDWSPWLDGDEAAAVRLLRSPAEGLLRCWPVSTKINNLQHDGCELLRPLATN